MNLPEPVLGGTGSSGFMWRRRMAKRARKQDIGITTFKGFDKNLSCRGFQYEIGGTYDNGGEPVVRCAEHGFHACEHPLDVFGYYPPVEGNRYAIVTQSGQIDRAENEDTKIASAKITINTEIRLGEFGRGIAAWFAKTFSGIAAEEETANTAGYSAHANTAGYSAHASTSGYRAHANTAGNSAHASTSGYRAHANTAGESAHASTSGCRAHASTAGCRAHANTSGNSAHASTSGNNAHASTSGYRAHANTAGGSAHASVKGRNSIAAALGIRNTASAEEGGAIALAAYDDNYNLVAVRSSMVGQNGIEAGKTYRLSVSGEFEEVVAA